MFPVIAAGVGVLVLIALLSRGGPSPSPTTQLDVPYDKPQPDVVPGTPTPTETDKSIDKDIEEVVTKVEETKTAVSSLNIASLKSPIPKVTDKQWQTYVKKSISAKQGTVSKGNNLGMFLIGMRILEDQGYTKDVTKDTAGVWQGTWIAPYSLRAFLDDANLQYAVFKKMTMEHFSGIMKRYKDPIVLEGLPKPTLSGLLGVAKQAGPTGLDKWMKESPTARKPNTTAAYTRTNGIF
jgi:hypothetical protein